MPIDDQTGIYFDIKGEGPCLMLGFPYFASYNQIMPEGAPDVHQGLVQVLSQRYRVLSFDYPSIGLSSHIEENKLTSDRVVSDMLSVADAANFNEFAFIGYSWGAAAGLQLAARTNRLTALAIGGWPPLGGEYALMLRSALEQVDAPPEEVQVVLRNPEQYRQWVHFYQSVQGFDERGLLAQLVEQNTPRLVFVGAEGDVLAGRNTVANATIISSTKSQLSRLGWQVKMIEGAGHEVGLEADKVLAVIEPFLKQHLGVEGRLSVSNEIF